MRYIYSNKFSPKNKDVARNLSSNMVRDKRQCGNLDASWGPWAASLEKFRFSCPCMFCNFIPLSSRNKLYWEECKRDSIGIVSRTKIVKQER